MVLLILCLLFEMLPKWLSFILLLTNPLLRHVSSYKIVFQKNPMERKINFFQSGRGVSIHLHNSMTISIFMVLLLNKHHLKHLNTIPLSKDLVAPWLNKSQVLPITPGCPEASGMKWHSGFFLHQINLPTLLLTMNPMSQNGWTALQEEGYLVCTYLFSGPWAF